MILSLRNRLSLTYIIVALIGVALIGILANLLLEQQFRKYIRENQERLNQQIVAQLSQEYIADGSWQTEAIDQTGMNALEQGLILKVKDNFGRTIWDATVHNNGLCQQMIMHLAKNMISRYPNWKGGYTEQSYELINSFKKVGIVQIGFYGPFYYRDNDLAFINTLNQILFGVAILALMVALIIGALTARTISIPISRLIQSAQLIAGGDYRVKSFFKSNIREISQINSAINEMAEALQKQENLRRQLTSDVAHELRTPITTLQSHLEAIIDGVWEPTIPRLKGCHEEMVRLSKMVQDLEKLTKYESGHLALDKGKFDLSEIIRQLLVNFETEAHQKGIQISFTGSPVMIEVDKDKISQVFVNLLSNSLKFTQSGGQITIFVNPLGDGAKVRVKDNGPGIHPNDLPYIFERFYRADKSRNRMTGGSGIGLAITKAIVEAHGGKIRVESQLGEGAEFVIDLP